MTRIAPSLLLSALALLLAHPGHALSVVLDAVDSGWHSSAGTHQITNENYSAGWSNEEFRNFFVFDLSDLPAGETIISATLHAYNPADGEPDASYEGGYDSPDASETYQLHEVLALSTAVTAPSLANPTIYDDLGDGPIFGSTQASVLDNGQFIDVELNAAGLSQLDSLYALAAEVVLGGRLSSLTSAFGVEEAIWSHTDPPNANMGSPYDRQLIVVVTPEPGTALLLGFGLLAIGVRRRG